MARNQRVREQFQLALDGPQIAGVVLGALVAVAVAFGMGVKVGKHLSAAQDGAERSGDLAALDAGAVAPQAEPTLRDVRYNPALEKQTVPAPPPAEKRPVPPPAAAAQREATPAPAVQHEPPPAAVAAAPAAAAPSTPVEAPPAAVPEPSRPEPTPAIVPARTAPVPAAAPPPASTPSAARGGWVLQLASTPSRAEADRIAAKYRKLTPRVEGADIPGKGHYYRVRAGRFETRQQAEKYRQDVARETGVKGFVTSAP